MATDVKIGVKVDDHGSLKETGKHARSLDRSLRGTAKMSANSTKNLVRWLKVYLEG